jgi:hypothetical protein
MVISRREMGLKPRDTITFPCNRQLKLTAIDSRNRQLKLTAIDSGIEILLNEADGNRFRD